MVWSRRLQLLKYAMSLLSVLLLTITLTADVLHKEVFVCEPLVCFRCAPPTATHLTGVAGPAPIRGLWQLRWLFRGPVSFPAALSMFVVHWLGRSSVEKELLTFCGPCPMLYC
jgi:hypothetical protein